MLIKIDGNRYINPDHISMIAPCSNGDDNAFFIALLGRNFESEAIETTAAVIAYLLIILDADENYSDMEVSLSLTSRVAIHLSNSAEPQTLEQIGERTGLPSLTDLETSTNDLLARGVIRSELRDGVPYYSHAANARPFEDLAVLDNGDSAW